MGVIEHSVEEEPLIKKVKMTDNELQNSAEAAILSQNESGVDVNIGNEQSPLLDTEVNKETCVASGDGRKKKDDLCSVAVEEEGKEVEVVSGEATIEKLPVSELDKNDEASALLSVTSRDEIPVIEKKDFSVASGGTGDKETCVASGDVRKKNHDLCSVAVDEGKEVDVVSDEANKEKKLPVLDGASSLLSVTNRDEIPGSCSSLESSLVSVSRKKLLVLDLNGLLADIVSIFPDCKADINIGRRAIFKRPFCEDFLKFCFEKFEVGIWSSRKRTNVERIAAFLLGDLMSKLLFCWDMSYCTTTTVGSLENRYKVVVFKDLNRLWEKHDSRLPWKKGDYNETNTVLLDDSPYKALLNPPYTAIYPHSYTHQNTTDTSLGDGGDLRLHLEKLVEAENVQEFIKNNPFGQEAITETSESWEFYRQAIHLTRASSSHTNTHRF